MNNSGKVFGEECPFFGKLLYLFMSGGYDRQKISLLKFIESLMPLYNSEHRLNFNRLAFRILDFDRDNVLNVLNILHMWKNIDPRTKFGEEIFQLINWEITNNMSTSATKRKE